MYYTSVHQSTSGESGVKNLFRNSNRNLPKSAPWSSRVNVRVKYFYIAYKMNTIFIYETTLVIFEECSARINHEHQLQQLGQEAAHPMTADLLPCIRQQNYLDEVIVCGFVASGVITLLLYIFFILTRNDIDLMIFQSHQVFVLVIILVGKDMLRFFLLLKSRTETSHMNFFFSPPVSMFISP